MRVMMVYYGFYVTVHGGGAKTDRFIMEALARRGHDCRVLIPTSYTSHQKSEDEFIHRLQQRSINYQRLDEGVLQFELNSVPITAVSEKGRPDFLRSHALRLELRRMAGAF